MAHINPKSLRDFFNLLRVRVYDITFKAGRSDDCIVMDDNESFYTLSFDTEKRSNKKFPFIGGYEFKYDEIYKKFQIIKNVYKNVNITKTKYVVDDEIYKNFDTIEDIKESIIQLIHDRFKELEIDADLGDLSKWTDEDTIKYDNHLERTYVFSFGKYFINLFSWDNFFKLFIFFTLNIFIIYIFSYDNFSSYKELLNQHKTETIIGSIVYLLANIVTIFHSLGEWGGEFSLRNKKTRNNLIDFFVGIAWVVICLSITSFFINIVFDISLIYNFIKTINNNDTVPFFIKWFIFIFGVAGIFATKIFKNYYHTMINILLFIIRKKTFLEMLDNFRFGSLQRDHIYLKSIKEERRSFLKK